MIKKEFRHILTFVLSAAFLLCAGNVLNIKYLPKSVQSDKAEDLKILALMVQFEEDDLGYTTGNGTFDSEYEYPDSLPVDAVSHDKEYFKDQLQFVKNYFEAESNGRITISTITVIDTLQNSVTVRLPHPMWYYNPNNGDDILAERLIELYSDSWSQIAQDTSIAFNNYNTFVIFHAGSGQEFNPGYDETPFDIPSVFLSLKDITGAEITAHDGTVIDNSVILPECEWQIYNGDWYYAGMSGISCLMFAHRIGIPNMYSSASGKSCIGKFGLMDQGSANFSGMLPAGVTAWVKELKGWETVRTIDTPEENIKIKADSTVYRIDINSDEYFLIENRTPVNFTSVNNEIFGYDRDGRRIKYFYDANGIERYNIIDAGFKTLVSIQDNDYDFGLPLGYNIENGSTLSRNKGGILVWHIDKTQTTDYNIENNLINDDYDHRGVYIEEADGSFDIGKDYWLLDNGYGTEFGWHYDAFFSDNDVWLDYANRSLNEVEFSSISYPRADTNDGIQTGIKLHDFSTISREMFFSYSFEEPEINYSLDPGLGKAVYLPAYLNESLLPNILGSIRHYFAGQDGNYKIFDKDSLLYTGSFGDSVSVNFIPVQVGNNVITVNSDSTEVFLTDIASGTASGIEIGAKIISQPVDRIIATDNGIYKLYDDMTLDSISTEFKKAQKLSVLTDGGGFPIFIKGENNGTLFTIDLSQSPYAVETKTLPQDSINYSFILSDITPPQVTAKVFSFAESDDTVRLGWNDIDRDSKLESITAFGNVLSLKNESGIYENGFPLSTELGYISKAFIFNGNIAVIDSSSNYDLISSDGDYQAKNIRTMNGFGNNSGLLNIDSSVFLYNFSGTGILTYHKIGTGGLRDYLNMIKGVFELKDDLATVIPFTIISKNVYNWPNPARGEETNFRFFLNIPCEVKIEIYDINGNRIETLDQEFSQAGEYCELVWNVRNVPSGIYNAILRFKSDSDEEVRKVKAAVIK